MPDDLIITTVQSQNTFVYGRTLNTARNHNYIIDGTREPKEELNPVEVFLGAVSSCCVQWVEQFAREESVELIRIHVEMEGVRRADETNRFQYVTLNVVGAGPDQAQLEDFVHRFTERCPLYRTVATATEVRVSVSATQMMRA